MLTFYKKMRMLLCIFAMLVSSSVWAAFMKNVPQTLTQPNGVIVNAFATGDEYYNWIHDTDGYTILKNKKTGNIIRVDEVQARQMAGSQWSYVPKSEWKSQQNPKKVEDAKEA